MATSVLTVVGARAEGALSTAGGALSTRGLLTASCQESSPAAPIRWAARYEPVRQGDGATAIRIVDAGQAAPGDAISTVAGAWDLSWSTAAGRQATARSALITGSHRTIDASAASLLSPDGNCSLYLSVPAAKHRLVGVIGDSVFAAIAQQVRSESSPLRTLPASTWEIRATSGFGWGASAPAWPLKTVTGTWAIGLARGIFAQHPSALVVELGANDAMRAAFAKATRHPSLTAVLDGVSSDVKGLLEASADARVPCVVIVTAPEHSTTLFGAGPRYAVQAERVNQVVASDALAAGGHVKIADWATLSKTHHEGQDDWFDPDDVHPNLTGEAALVALVQQSIQSCPAPHSLTVSS
ncbi:MAG: GDSL-type esterase/lipase family protein [Acidimicrobiales bacterium]